MKSKIINIVILSVTISTVLHAGHITAQTGEEMINRVEMLEEGTLDTAVMQGDEPGRRTAQARRYDTTTISLGNRDITIIEANGKTDISISDRGRMDRPESYRRSRPFRGHWRGLDIGLNNYVNSDFSTSLGADMDYMELAAARSVNLGINVLQYSLAISDNNIGLVTGVGFEYNNYRFSNDVSIIKENREIVPVWYDDPGISVDRSRLRAIYLNVPLLLEFQTRHTSRARRAHFAAGVTGGVNIGSNTRVVYKDNSSRSRERVRDDFYLSPFRYGITLRAGYRSMNLYANYYPVALFQDGKGPELYPFAIGFSLLSF
ncbi:MAG: PorT family protein [Marinilabiliales bacterium]|nr:MAG: PorT family protein [Marinilabiliales bacterium]